MHIKIFQNPDLSCSEIKFCISIYYKTHVFQVLKLILHINIIQNPDLSCSQIVFRRRERHQHQIPACPHHCTGGEDHHTDMRGPASWVSFLILSGDRKILMLCHSFFMGEHSGMQTKCRQNNLRNMPLTLTSEAMVLSPKNCCVQRSSPGRGYFFLSKFNLIFFFCQHFFP